MKKIFLIVFLSLILINIRIKANPISIYFHINELSIDTSGWKMEIYTNDFGQDSVSLDGWILTSRKDTSYIKKGKFFNLDGYLIITNIDLVSELEINEKGDTISLFNPDTLFQDNLIFGDSIPNSPILSPKTGQSICKGSIVIPFSSITFLYLDNTPTFGKLNDTLNAMGYVEGFVKDENGVPVKNVTVIYSYIKDYNYLIDSSFVLTDSSGYFKFKNYAKISNIYFKDNNYCDTNKVLQIWPDSIVTLDDVRLITGLVEKIPSNIINEFNLTQNFPNPFNNSTSFFYILPEGNYVDIKIYDEIGELVQKIFSGYQSAGKYKVHWNADNLASGVYIYQVNTGSFNISKKAILLK